MANMTQRKPVKTLKYWREKRGLTLEELGEAVGLSKGSMGDYEKGRRIPRMDMAYRFASVLDVEVNQISNWIPDWYVKAQKQKQAASQPAQ